MATCLGGVCCLHWDVRLAESEAEELQSEFQEARCRGALTCGEGVETSSRKGVWAAPE